ncbi:MAG TPA: HAMP domain-containing sensor histidine kinase [Candidatus Solibacter sp.]|nr:HAMP domain-containing sensor histidine kinase [Candidatus Solibacter sp.]
MKLSQKVALIAVTNLLLLAAVFVLFVRSQFQSGQSLLLGPVQDRIMAIANRFSVELTGTAGAAVNAVFASYRRRYSADFFLTTPSGEVLAGPEIEPPPQVLDRMRRPPIVRAGSPPPPPPEEAELPPPEADPPPPRDGPPPRDEEQKTDRRKDDRKGQRRGPPPKRNGAPAEPVFFVITHNPTIYWAGARIPVTVPDVTPGAPAILLIRSDTIFNNALFLDLRLWVGMVLGVIAVSVACWLPFIRGLTRAIAQMDRATAHIAEGRFDTQVAVNRSDELGDLGAQINRLAARLDSFVKNQKRFLGDIAHELCAPIARVQFAVGILEQKAGDEQRPRVAALYEEVQEMSALVNELLSFSKAGLNPETVPLAAVDVGAAVDRAAARETFAGASIETKIPAGLTALANEGFLVRALSNVLRNAVRYAGKSGPITASAERAGGDLEIHIADSGPGLPESELEQIFAPFYRPEAARTRETGGAGLGLAIVKTCVEACGGTVAAHNRQPSGLEIVIRLKPA